MIKFKSLIFNYFLFLYYFLFFLQIDESFIVEFDLIPTGHMIDKLPFLEMFAPEEYFPSVSFIWGSENLTGVLDK